MKRSGDACTADTVRNFSFCVSGIIPQELVHGASFIAHCQSGKRSHLTLCLCFVKLPLYAFYY